jgi:hypothetical protein
MLKVDSRFTHQDILSGGGCRFTSRAVRPHLARGLAYHALLDVDPSHARLNRGRSHPQLGSFSALCAKS